MELQLRKAKGEDIPQLLSLYNEFSRTFVCAASRNRQDFRRELRKKDNVNLVALDKQNCIAGYVRAHLEKRFNRGEFEEIIVLPKYDFEQVAKLLVEKVNDILVKKKVISIVAGSMRNPAYERIFSKLGFLESESNSVFMYVILDAQKFLNELQPALAARLSSLKEKNILVQIECEGSSIFLIETSEGIQPFIFTNQPVDFKVVLSREILTKLVFGIADALELAKTGQLKIEPNLSEQKANRILKTLFPKRQFLIMDYW